MHLLGSSYIIYLGFSSPSTYFFNHLCTALDNYFRLLESNTTVSQLVPALAIGAIF